jgi:tetratricopeptide (TPR) repeat protein
LPEIAIDDDVVPLYSEGKDLLVKFKQADGGGKRQLIESVWKLLSQLSDAARGCHKEGRLESAYALYKLVLEYSKVLEDQYAEGQNLNNLGQVCRAMKRFDEALRHYSQALQIFKAMDSKLEEAAVLGNIGLVQEDLGNLAEAKAAYQRALTLNPSHTEAQEALKRLETA